MNHTSQVMICVCVIFFVMVKSDVIKGKVRPFPDAGGGKILEGIHEFYWYEQNDHIIPSGYST